MILIKKVFLSILNDYTESIYKHRQQKLIDDAIRLILNRGHLEDGSNDMAAAVIFSGLKKTNETDFPLTKLIYYFQSNDFKIDTHY